MAYQLKLNGKRTGPPFARYVDAFNYRAAQNLVGAVVHELDEGRDLAAEDDLEARISERENGNWRGN